MGTLVTEKKNGIRKKRVAGQEISEPYHIFITDGKGMTPAILGQRELGIEKSKTLDRELHGPS